MSSDRLRLVVYRDPVTNGVYIGDQYGRVLEDVASFSMHTAVSGKRGITIELSEITGLISKPALVTHPPKTPAAGKAYAVEYGTGSTIPLSSKPLIHVSVPSADYNGVNSSAYQEFAQQLADDIGDDAHVLVTPDSVTVRVVSLDTDYQTKERTLAREPEEDWL